MTDEEMAEEYADNISGLELTCSLISAKDKNHAYRLGRYEGFLAGLKAGRPQWHKVADGDLPEKPMSVLAYFKEEDISLVECLYIPDEGFKHPVFSEWYEPTAWIEKEKILPGVFAGLA